MAGDGNIVNPPITPVLPYPGLTTVLGIAVVIAVTLTVLVVLRRFGGSGASAVTPRFIMTLAVVVGFIGLTAYAARYSMPENEAGGQLLGALISAFTIVISYWFRGPGDGGPPHDED